MTNEPRFVTAQEAGYNALLDAGYTRAQIRTFRDMRKLFEKAAFDQNQINRKEARRNGNVT